MAKQLGTAPRVEREWVKALPGMLQDLMYLLREHGRICHSDEAWANYESKGLMMPGLEVEAEGDDESGPYRVRVFSMSLDESTSTNEPLLSLEIRPTAWWFNEVKATINDPGRIVKHDAVTPAVEGSN